MLSSAQSLVGGVSFGEGVAPQMREDYEKKVFRSSKQRSEPLAAEVAMAATCLYQFRLRSKETSARLKDFLFSSLGSIEPCKIFASQFKTF